MNFNFVSENIRVGIPVKVRKSYNTSTSCCSCSDQPILNYTTMHERKKTKLPEVNDYERAYWKKIHELNNAEFEAKARERRRYVVTIVELVEIDHFKTEV
jgi:hypothetical protein